MWFLLYVLFIISSFVFVLLVFLIVVLVFIILALELELISVSLQSKMYNFQKNSMLYYILYKLYLD